MNRFLLIACLLVPMAAVAQKPDLGRNTTGMLPGNRVVSAPQSGSRCLHDSADGLQVTEASGDCVTSTNGAVAVQSISAGNLNGTPNASSCSALVPPLWCSGSDIGGWTNAAISTLAGCGDVSIDRGSYNFLTQIILPMCVTVGGDGLLATSLHFTPTSGSAIALNVAGQIAGGLRGLSLYGPGDATTADGITMGGASVSSVLTTFIDVDIETFHRGIVFSNNTWLWDCIRCRIGYNNTGIYVPASPTNAGENMSITDSVIQNNIQYAIYQGGDFAPFWAFHVSHTSFDYNGDGVNAPIVGGLLGNQNHFEQTTGPFFDNSTGGGYDDFGSTFYLANSGTTACFGNLTVGNAPSNVFTGSIFSSNATVTDLFCGTGQNQVTLNGIQVTGQAHSLKGTNYFPGQVSVADGVWGSRINHAAAYCETGGVPTTLALGGTATTTALNCLPAGAVIDAVVYRITTTITTAVNFTVGDSGSATRYCGTQSVMTSGTTGVCSAAGYYVNASALGVKITTNANPGAGAIRLIVYYHTFTPPTS